MSEVKAINGCVLVELSDEYANVATPERQYQTKTSGKVISWADDLPVDMFPTFKGMTAYFEEYKDGTKVNLDGKECAFIKYRDIRGIS